eukprot:8495254-Prorocentrum_lima.AAC.1
MVGGFCPLQDGKDRLATNVATGRCDADEGKGDANNLGYCHEPLPAQCLVEQNPGLGDAGKG